MGTPVLRNFAMNWLIREVDNKDIVLIVVCRSHLEIPTSVKIWQPLGCHNQVTAQHFYASWGEPTGTWLE